MGSLNVDISAFFKAHDWFTSGMEVLCFSDLFGNDQPVEVEIGCGKGKFLIARACEEPRVNFFGIDRVGKWMKSAQIRAEKKQLHNLRFLKAEAREFLGHLSSESVSVFHIYFPDPWPKKRHHKRRLITSHFLGVLHLCLVPGGTVEIATDDASYITQMAKAVEETKSCWRRIRQSENCRLVHESLMTNYELKYQAQGKPLYYLELLK